MLSPVVLVVLLCTFTINEAADKKLPSYFKVCERDEKFEDCIITSTNNLRPYLKKGIRTFQIPSLEPLLLDEVRLNEGQGPVSINLKLTKLTVRGGEKYRVTKVKNELDKYKLHFKIDLPELELVGNYEMNGRALLLPLRGNGRANITVYDISPEATLIGKPVTKNDKLFMEVEDFPVKIGDARALSLDFENLFGGNKQLGASMNRFLNDNWQDIMRELRPVIEDVVSAILISSSRGIFSSIPFDTLFPEKRTE